MAEWLTDVQARALLGLGPGEAGDDDTAFGGAVEAAVSYVEGKRPELFEVAPVITDPPVFMPTPQVLLGTAMLANRWYERRASPLGTAQYAEFGGSILRNDPDISRLLGLGDQGGFRFGAGRALPVVEIEVE